MISEEFAHQTYKNGNIAKNERYQPCKQKVLENNSANLTFYRVDSSDIF